MLNIIFLFMYIQINFVNIVLFMCQYALTSFPPTPQENIVRIYLSTKSKGEELDESTFVFQVLSVCL